MSEYAQGGCGFQVPWWAEAEEEDEWEMDDEDVCPRCGGDGGDPMSDYALPCPECGE